MAGHPYFTRSKDSKDSFPNQSLSKGKEKMTEKCEDIGLTEVTVMDPVIAEQNKLIAQLIQQNAEMRVEIQKTRELVNLAIATSVPASDDGKPPLYVPPPNTTVAHAPNNPIIISAPKAHSIHLTTPDPHHASSSYQVSIPSQNLNAHNSHTFPPALQIPTQSIQNPPTTQPTSSKAIFLIPMPSESYLPPTPYFEPNHYKEEEKEWKAKGYGLKAGKINQAASQMKSSGLLRRKREDASFEPKSKRHAIFDGQKHSLSKTYPQAPQKSYPAFSVQTDSQTPQSNYQSIPPNYQAPLPNYQSVIPDYQAPLPNYQSIPPNYQAPLPNYQNTLPSYRAPQYPDFQMPAPTYQNPPEYHQRPLSSQNNHNALRPNLVKKPPRIFTPLFESRTQLYERLKAAGMLHPIKGKPANPLGRFYRADQRCAYHSGSVGHTTENCINLKHKIQDLIDQRVINFQIVTPNVNSNPMSNNEGLTISMIEGEED